MKRLRPALLLLLLGLGVAALLVARRLPEWSAGFVAGRLAQAFERPARVGEVRFGLWPVRVEIHDLSIGALTSTAPPFLHVRRLVVEPVVQSLWGARLVLESVRVEGPTIRINAFPRGGDDIPKPRGRRGGGAEVRIRRLRVDAGLFVLNHMRVPLTLDLPDFRGELRGEGGGVLRGRVSFGPGELQFADAPVLPIGTDIEMLLDGGTLTVTRGLVRAEGTQLSYGGQILLQSRPQGQLVLEGPVSLSLLDRHLMRTGFDLYGAARYRGTLGIDGSRLTLRGELSGTAGRFDGVPVPSYAGAMDWDANGVHIRNLVVEALGGRAAIDIEVPPRPKRSTWSGRLEGVDAEATLMAIFDMGAAGIAARVSGSFALDWPRGEFRPGLTGRIGVDLTAEADGRRRPLSGRLDWRAEDGVQFVDAGRFSTPTTDVRLSGRIEADDRSTLELSVETADIADAEQAVLRLRRALNNPEAQIGGFEGRGRFDGTWTGTLAEPVFAGRVTARDVRYRGVDWGEADWVGEADSLSVTSRSLVVRRDEAELWLDGRTEIGWLGAEDALEARLRLTAWPAEDLLKALDFDLDVEGPASGELELGGRRSEPRGPIRLTMPYGRYYGIAFEAARLDGEMRGAVTQGRGTARLGDGELAFSGSLSDDGMLDGHVRADGVELSHVLPPLAEGVTLGGRISGEGAVQGPTRRPRLAARLRSPRLFLGDEGLGELAATLSASAGGRISIDAEARSPRVDLHVTGDIAADAPHEAALTLTVRDTSVDPFLRVLSPALPASVGIVTSGELRLSGPLLEPTALRIEADVPELLVALPDYPMRNVEPLDLGVRDGRVQLRHIHLAGDGTDLELHGEVALLAEGPVTLEAAGRADLRALSAVTRRLRGRGDARLELNVSGTRDAPQVSGVLELAGAALRARGFPHGLEDVRGEVRFTDKDARFDGVAGRFGGGDVELTGQATYAQGRLGSFDIDASARGVSLRYPEGLRSRIDAALRFFGDAEVRWLTGRVDVRQAAWTRRYDLASELLAGGTFFEEPVAVSEGGLRLDLEIDAPGTLRLDNNLASLQARARLRLQGTETAPVVLGRAEVDRGRLYFQGNTYQIRRGVIEFANPRRVDPLFDIEAETRLRSYRVTLRAAGTLERVSPTLSSDPPLSAVQILSLLAGADDVSSLTQAQADRANLAATGAATLAAGALSEEVGLEREAERLFGLNRFSIDPSALKGGVTNPSARLTVGKRLTPDLSVLYSIDLRGTEDRLLSVEYTLSDQLSLLFTSSDPDGLGFDVRWRQTFR